VPTQIEEHGRFQLEAMKLGRAIVFQVTVYRRKDSRRERLFAETQCSDPVQHIIRFVIRDEPSVDGIIQRFRLQLTHRGFIPSRVRFRQGTAWQAWQPIELTEEERRELPPSAS
jgi:hypothetical protein